MQDGRWVSVTEYSQVVDVSVSTVRRRIQNNSIKFRKDKRGNYLIWIPNTPNESNPSHSVTSNLATAETFRALLEEKDKRILSLEQDKKTMSGRLENLEKNQYESLQLFNQRWHELNSILIQGKLLPTNTEDKYLNGEKKIKKNPIRGLFMFTGSLLLLLTLIALALKYLGVLNLRI